MELWTTLMVHEVQIATTGTVDVKLAKELRYFAKLSHFRRAVKLIGREQG